MESSAQAAYNDIGGFARSSDPGSDHRGRVLA
jgi:hypothetical protein